MESKEKKSVNKILTEEIINQLKDGHIGWLKPTSPVNAKTGRPYSGLNRFLLSLKTEKCKDNRFLTFKEITSLGGKVLPNEKGNLVFFASSGALKIPQDKPLEEVCKSCVKFINGKCAISEELRQIEITKPKSEQQECSQFRGKKNIQTTKYYRVWNIAQTDINPDDIRLVENRYEKTNIYNKEAIKELLKNLNEKIRFVKSDVVRFDHILNVLEVVPVPKEEATKLTHTATAALIRGICYAVGGSDKFLNLQYMQETKETKKNPQDAKLSYGNIVAEMATAIVAYELGVSYSIRRDAGYIAELIAQLEKDSRFILMAGNSATKISKKVLELAGISEKEDADEESAA